MDAFDSYHYVPVLYARAAEFNAAKQLRAEAAALATPLWVVPPIPLDYQTGAPRKTFDDHVADVARKLSGAWAERDGFVDSHLLRDERSATSANTTETVLDQLHGAGFLPTPVLHEDATDLERSAVSRFAQERRTDIALRLSAVLWAELGTPVADAALSGLVLSTGLPVESLHLIIDLGDQVSTPANLSSAAVRGALAELDSLERWKTVTVMGTAMPATTAEVGKDSSAELPRSEWEMWKILKDGKRRRASFGDYAVQSVDALSTFNPLYMQVAAQLRYTVSSSWFVARGGSTKIDGFSQSHRLAAEIVNHPEFAGRDFSAGDAWIEDCANRQTTSGNATTWRDVTTNHHITLVADQLSTFRGH